MAFELLPRAFKSRIAKPAPVLPSSSLVGLALPLAALGIVLIGMNLHVTGLVLWAIALGLIGFALERKYAIATALLVAAGGAVLWQLVIGTAQVNTESERLSFVVVTLLAWLVGQFGAAVSRQNAVIRADQVNLQWFEEIIRTIFDGSRDCIKLIAEDGTVLAINESGLELVGASREVQMLGQHWFDFWDSDQRKVMQQVWQSALATGKGEFTGSCRILTGERRNWHSVFTRVQLPGSSDPSILCISRDITAMQRSQQNLKESVAQLNGLLNSISDAFVALDNTWTIDFMNHHCIDMFKQNGFEGGPGDNFWQLFGDDGNATSVAIRQVMVTRTIRHAEHFFAPRNTWFSFTIFPTDGGGIGLFVRDITALKLAEQQVKEEHTRLLMAQEITGYGDWSFDYELGQMRFSPRAVAMLQLGECPPHEYKKRLLERLHPQDRMTLVQAIINSSVETPRVDLTVRVPDGDGGDGRHFHWIGQLIVGVNGEPASMLGAVQDVTAQITMQQAQSHARRLVREIIDALPQRICVIDQQGHYVTVNQLWEKDWIEFNGDKPMPDDFFESHQVSKRVEHLIEDLQPYLSAVRQMLDGERDRYEMEYELHNRDGALRHYLVQAVPMMLDNARMVVFSHSDITSIKDMEHTISENERAMQALAENLEEVFWVYDLENARMAHVSSAFEKIYKAPRDILLDPSQDQMQFVHPDDLEHLSEVVQRHLMRDTSIADKNVEYRIIDAEGETHWLSSNSVYLRNPNNEITHSAGITRDLTAYKLHEQELYRAAYRDDITDLPNRKALLRDLERRCNADNAVFALVLINLDRFKNVNDTLGHGVGDDILRRVGRRLREAFVDTIYLARLGGDEFAAICAIDQQQSTAEAALQSFDAPFRVADEQLFLTASIGIVLYPEQSDDINELLKFASVAQLRAKNSGRNTIQLFEGSMMSSSRDQLVLENELRGALTRDEFELFYQGKFNLISGELVGAEVLLRWHSQPRGLVSPADFIPLLEETGMILPVGEWILHAACRQVQQWHQAVGSWLSVAVNVSPVQLANRQFAQRAAAILAEYAIPKEVIELEITESALMADLAHGAHVIEALKQAGFKIALDDFGTGYSSLGYLRKFAPDTLKIDRSFVADLVAVENDVEIVAGILQLAHALKIEVVAEGIEEVAQRDLLTALGCECGQGFLFCKPMPVDQFELLRPEFFRSSRPSRHGAI